MKKRIVAMFLAVCFMISLLPTAAFAAEDNTAANTEPARSGYCGGDITAEAYTFSGTGAHSPASQTVYKNLEWKLVENGDGYTLQITGSGPMADFDLYYYTPWNNGKFLNDKTRDKISKIEIGENVTYIGANAFRFTEIKDITIPASVTGMGDYALTACYDLENITYNGTAAPFYTSDGVMYENTDEGKVLLYYPTKKTTGTFTVPSDVDVIGAQSMQYATFSGIVIPDSVKKIGDYAFSANENLTEITIPASVTSIGVGALKQCTALTKVILPEGIDTIPDNFLLKAGTNLTSIEIPDSVRTIGKNAFDECGLTSLSIGAGSHLETIGESAFQHCVSMTNATLNGAQIKTISKNAFYNCTALTSVSLPESVTTLGDNAFGSTALTEFNASVSGDLAVGATRNLFENVTTLTKVTFGSTGGTVTLNNSMPVSSIQNVRMFGNIQVNVSQLFKGIACTQYDLSGVTQLVDNSPDHNAFYEWRTNDKTPVVYVANESIRDVVRAVGTTSDNTRAMVFAVTNGGTFADTTVFTDGTLAAPEKLGAHFEGWYTKDGTEDGDWGNKVTAIAVNNTYYAKWHEDSTITTDIAEKEFVVGQPTEFTFTVKANSDKGTRVVGTSDFSDAEAIEKLEYYEVKDGKWYELTDNRFGTESGFEMSDASSRFRVTFKKAGHYTFTASMQRADNKEVLCSTKVDFTVAGAKHSITVVDADGNTLGTLPDAEEDTTVELGSSFTGITSGKKVESWAAKAPADLKIEKDEATGKYTFTMPTQDVTLVATLVDADPAEPDQPTDPTEPEQPAADDGAGTAVAVVLGGAAIGATAYMVGTQIWLETHMPDGVIPTSREQLALVLWNAAGKPQPASTALYADLSAEAVDSQLAARWCVEQGLLKDYGESFKPGDYTFRPQVIKAWNQVQEMIGQ